MLVCLLVFKTCVGRSASRVGPIPTCSRQKKIKDPGRSAGEQLELTRKRWHAAELEKEYRNRQQDSK